MNETSGKGHIKYVFVEAYVVLGLFLPQTQLFVWYIVSKLVAFAAAFDATFIRVAPAGDVPVATVLQQAGVPFQSEIVATGARLPQVLHCPAALQTWHLHCLRLEHGTLDA